MQLAIDTRVCTKCDTCRPTCPTDAIYIDREAKIYAIDANRCNACEGVVGVRCMGGCPVDAVVLETEVPQD